MSYFANLDLELTQWGITAREAPICECGGTRTVVDFIPPFTVMLYCLGCDTYSECDTSELISSNLEQGE